MYLDSRWRGNIWIPSGMRSWYTAWPMHWRGGCRSAADWSGIFNQRSDWIWRRSGHSHSRNDAWTLYDCGDPADSFGGSSCGIGGASDTEKSGKKKRTSIHSISCVRRVVLCHDGDGTVKGKKAEKGSFTVEISLIMSLLIPLLMCLIYLGFYMHDRAFLEGAALEAACTASLYAGEEMQEDYTESREQALLKERLFGVYNITGNVELGEETVKVSYSGEFQIPGMIAKFLEKTSLPIQAEAEVNFKDARKAVNQLYSLSKVLKGGKD